MKTESRPSPRLHRLYLVLAACNIITVAVASVVTSHLAEDHARSLAGYRDLSARLTRYEDLTQRVGYLGSPLGEWVLGDQPPNKLEKTYADNQKLRAAIHAAKTDLGQQARGQQADQLSQRLAAVERGRIEMMASIERMRTLRDGKRMDDCARALAAGRAARASALKAIDEMRRLVKGQQLRVLEVAEARSLREQRAERLLHFLVAVSIGAMALYGRRALLVYLASREQGQQIAAIEHQNRAFEHAIEGVAALNNGGYYTWVNRKFAEMLGYAPEEVIGTHASELIIDEDRPRISQGVDDLRKFGRTEHELRVTRKDGSIAHVWAVLAYRQGVGAFCFVKDITAQKQVEASLRLSEERFRLVTQATRDVIADWDLRKGTLWMNEAVHTELGYPADTRFTVDQWIETIHPDDRERFLVSMNHALAGKSRIWFEHYRVRRHDGTYAYVYDRTCILRDQDGVAHRLVNALTDMTARQEAEEKLERLSMQNRMILESAGDGIYGLDADGNVTFANPAAVAMLGWTAKDLCGSSLHERVHAKGSDGSPIVWTDCPVYRCLTHGEEATSKTTYWKKDGTSIPAELTTRPIRDVNGDIKGAVITFRDISARVAVERMKEEFISIVSHELRTPLTAIRGALGLIGAGRVGVVSEKMGRMLEIAVSNTDRLVRFINDILDIERMESGKIVLTRKLCSAPELIDAAVDLIRPIAEKAGVRLEVERAEGALFGDSDRLVQTLTNLIGNAIKFSPPDTTVSISATEEQREVCFTVSDQGRGIPASKLHAIFDRFQQVDASDSREKGGTGLGLAICRTIVRQHGGEIWAESGASGSGSRFFFTVPRIQPMTTAHPAPSRTVIVCEDDEAIRDLEIELLEEAGYRAIGFDSGESLLESGAAADAAAIVLDMGLPGMDGWETLRRLREDPRAAKVPVVIISGLPAVGGEIHEWLQKPLDADELLAAVERAMAHSRNDPRVLIIEPDIDLAGVLVASFERVGAEAYHAATGADAIALARTIRPDLLILDPVLPGTDGFGVVDWLRASEQLSKVPLIVYTASEPTPAERERLRLGPTEFFTKSRITPEDFERRAVRLLDTIVTAKGAMSHVA
jgi:PAS domain S-box-containing protein